MTHVWATPPPPAPRHDAVRIATWALGALALLLVVGLVALFAWPRQEKVRADDPIGVIPTASASAPTQAAAPSGTTRPTVAPRLDKDVAAIKAPASFGEWRQGATSGASGPTVLRASYTRAGESSGNLLVAVSKGDDVAHASAGWAESTTRDGVVCGRADRVRCVAGARDGVVTLETAALDVAQAREAFTTLLGVL